MTEIKVPKKNWELLNQKVAQIDKEVNGAHERIRNLIDRVMNLEHYIGLRSHSFEGDYIRQYDFQQIVKDLKKEERPQTLYRRKKARGM